MRTEKRKDKLLMPQNTGMPIEQLGLLVVLHTVPLGRVPNCTLTTYGATG